MKGGEGGGWGGEARFLELTLCLREFGLSGSAFDDVRNGDGRIAIGEVRIVTPTGNSDAKSVTRDAVHGHVVVLPSHPLTSL